MLEPYSAGILSDFGGGNVEWWQDYIRAELDRAHEFYQEQFAASAPSPAATVSEDDARLAAETEADKRYDDTGLANNVAWAAFQAGALWQRAQPAPAAPTGDAVRTCLDLLVPLAEAAARKLKGDLKMRLEAATDIARAALSQEQRHDAQP